MPAVQYPFIDIAVHERVRARFAGGEAIVLFSREMDSPLWANGLGADLFGNSSIYDFLEQGPNRQDVSFRQLEATARQLSAVGDRLTFLIRIPSGFQRIAVQASAELIRTNDGQVSVLFCAPVKAKAPGPAECARQMLAGFDDPDTHMAVLDGDGQVMAASPAYAALGITPQTARMLVTMAGNDAARLIKRPIPTGKGYLPAAIGKLSDSPALHLLFAVETVIGMLDPTGGFDSKDTAAVEPKASAAELPAGVAEVPVALTVPQELPSSQATPQDGGTDLALPADTDIGEMAPVETVAASPDEPALIADVPVNDAIEPQPRPDDHGYADAIDAVADIEDIDADPEDMADETEVPPELEELTEAQADLDDLAELDGVRTVGDAGQAVVSAVTADELEPDRPNSVLDMMASDPAVPPVPEQDDDELPFPLDEDEQALPEEIADALPDGIADDADSPAFAEIEAADVGTLPDMPIEETEADTASNAAAPEQAPVEESMSPLPVQTTPETAFVYNPSGRASRFVWKIDAAGRFSEVSGEFAQAVGPHAADINGIAFVDLAALFNLDPDGRITELLNKRDTWSGKTIHWPIEGTALMVPVDLAALPTYTRNRDFDGFRGFGIVRMADATDDPHAVGLSLTGLTADALAAPLEDDAAENADFAFEDSIEDRQDALATVTDGTSHAVFDMHSVGDDRVDSDDAPEVADFDNDPATQDRQDIDDAVGDNGRETETDAETEIFRETPEDAANRSWVQDEVPALRIVETPNRRYSDKIIQLEDRRSRSKDGLTPGEQAAFREIARQLDPEGKIEAGLADKNPVAPVTELANNKPETDVDDMAAHPDEATAATFESETAVSDDTGLDDGAVVAPSNEPANLPLAPDNVLPGADPVQASTDDQETPDDVAPDDTVDTLGDVLHSLIPARAKMVDGLSPDVIDQMPVALLVHGGDELIHGNPEFLRLTGYATLAELQEVGGLDALLQRQELEDKTEQPGGMMLVRADDALIPVTARLQSIRWGETTALMLALMPVDGGPAPGVRSDALDLADPVAMQMDSERSDRLQAEVEELRSILETATDGVVLIGMEGDIRSMNRSASALFNYDNAETQAKPFVMLFAHESQKAILDYLGGLAGHGVASVLNDGREVIGREASGGFLPLFMTIGRLTSSDGYCAVIRDITQWKRTEEELRGAKRAAETANAHKSDFLARVSHEIRTPLNAIIGFADMMATERFGPMGHARYVEYADDISRSGRHVLDIVNDLLDISKIEAGEMDLDFVAVGLNESISEAVSIVQQQANSQRVIIRTSLSQAVPQVVADLRSVKQIALNILSNAIRFTPSGGQIVVSTAYEQNGNVVLRIRDTGVGMTRTELEQAMKPFRQVMTGSRKRGDGTGLGLPLTKAMVDANRATFSIHSAPNEGTLVEVTFPSQRVLAN